MINCTETVAGVTPEQLRGFFEGWTDPPCPRTDLRLPKNSSHVVLAGDDATGRVVGFEHGGLVWDRELVWFYRRLGMGENAGMMTRNPDRQSGDPGRGRG